MDKDIFIKISNDRDERFRTITRVVQGENGRYVIKAPENSDAYVHVRNIVQNRCMLERRFQNSKIRLAQSELYGEGVRIAWVEGQSFADYLDKLIDDGEKEACLRSMDEYFSQLLEMDIHSYRKLPDDNFCFETDRISKSEQAVSGLDIDMLFQNVIYDEKEKCWTDYDYEWVLNCDIPVRFFIFRCLNYYLTTKKRVLFLGSDIYERYQISNADMELYSQMEEQFQKYIAGRTIPLWKMYKALGGTVVPVIPLAERRINCKYAEVFFDSGKGFCVEESEKVYVEEYIPGKFRVRLEFPTGTQKLRFDPARCGCFLHICYVRDDLGNDMEYVLNETDCLGEEYVFLHDDPQICISVSDEIYAVDLEYSLRAIDIDDKDSMYIFLEHYGERLAAIEKLQCELEKQQKRNVNIQHDLTEQRSLNMDLKNCVVNLQNQNIHLQSNLEHTVMEFHSVLDSNSWRLTEPIRRIGRIIKKYKTGSSDNQ
ncbi:MAG: hypothetical protein LUF88_10300 [Bacteroides fragilis]|nr:hypothetical protein [Bacteroides fragilis]